MDGTSGADATGGTDAAEGPNGPLLPEIGDMYPNVTVVRRGGEINAWDNADFRAAVKATGKKQVIVGGITTDVSRFSRKGYEYVMLNPKIVTGLHHVRFSLPP